MEIDGTLLPSKDKGRVALTSEGVEIVKRMKDVMEPEIKKTMSFGFDRSDAEYLTVLSCVRRVNEAKTYMNKNYGVAGIFSAVALGIIVQSEQPNLVGRVMYEVKNDGMGNEGGKNNFYDVLNVKIGKERVGANIPTPMIEPVFMRILAEKVKITPFLPDYSHNRQTVENSGQMKDKGRLVVDTLLEMGERIDLKYVVESVFGKSEGFDNKSICFVLDRMNQVKNGEISKSLFEEMMIKWDENVVR